MTANVLLVEDEWLIAEDYASTLRRAGHEVVGPCPTITVALARIESESIDAALLDMDLGGEKSFPIAQRLKESKIPFTFFSGHGLSDLPESLRHAEVLPKPVERTALLEAVKRMCPDA